MKFATKPCAITHLTLGMLLHYLEKLRIQIFCRYPADIKCSGIRWLHFEIVKCHPGVTYIFNF